MGDCLKRFINAIVSIVIMLKQHSDPKGEAHAMLPTSRPRALHTYVIGLMGVYTSNNGVDNTWMDHALHEQPPPPS
jgi:hypothetical protein